MGLASRGCLVIVLGATAERRNLFFRSDLGLPWIRTLRSTPFIQVKQQNELGRAFNGHRADHHQFLCAHIFGRIDSIDADIARHPRADRRAFGPFHAEDTGTPTTAMVPSPVNLSTVLGDW